MKTKKFKFPRTLIITLAHLLIITTSFAQAPQKMSYQAVIRDTSNGLVASHAVGMRISIIQGSIYGASVYVETQTPTTNINGLTTLEIGAGTVVIGTFAGIDWSAGPYFIKTETDPSGGTNYTITGVSQLLSVPYALYAETSGTPGPQGIQGPTGPSGIDGAQGTTGLPGPTGLQGATGPAGYAFAHYVGELYGGGVVFWVDHTGDHGLICSMIDNSTGIIWTTAAYQSTTVPFPGAKSDWNGQANTTAIVSQAGAGITYAAGLCDAYTNVDYGTGVFSDWYLPSRGEFNHLWNNIYQVQKALESDGNLATTAITNDYYWLSSEYTSNIAWIFTFYYGLTDYYCSKSNTYCVRAVRAF